MAVQEKLSERDLGWICGLFEGEGSLPSNNSKGKRMNITSTDEDVIRRFAELVQCGRVSQDLSKSRQEKMRQGGKPVYVWSVANWKEIEPLLRVMLPLMGKRRSKKFEEALNNPQQAWRDRGHLPGVHTSKDAKELLGEYARQP